MQSKLIRYPLTAVSIAVSFWFYFQLDTYPYKVARWVQPLEATWVSLFARQCSAGAGEPAAVEPEAGWLGAVLHHALTHQGAYSAQVSFVSPQRQATRCTAGYRQQLLGERVNDQSRYRYASTSKLMTTAAIAQLVNAHKIDVNDRLVRFFPELTGFSDARIGQITLAHLLDHSAGFNRLTLSGDPMFLRRNKPWCPRHMQQLQTLTLAFNPGEKHMYSNLGYCLLGEVIHRVTGQDYRTYVEQAFSLRQRNITFIADHYAADEVRYDYRYEEWYNDSYLTLFDFEALSAVAGLSGSASALAGLLWDIHHGAGPSPFARKPAAPCYVLPRLAGCLSGGVFHYQPEPYGIALHYHEGYLPGAASVAVVDSFGGVTVLLKSGANRPQQNPEHGWIRFLYQRLSLHYTLQGQVPVLVNEYH